MVNAISVDLEDWYHICDFDNSAIQKNWEKYHAQLENNVNKIMHLFERYNIHATFFIVGIIAENAPGLIKKIVNAGHEIATHGFSHQRIFDMTPEEFEKDLLYSKNVIEGVSGKKVLGYRAPEWSLKKNNIWALGILKKHEFCYDASAVPLSHLGGRYFGLYPYEVKTEFGNLVEFPLSTFRCLWERVPFSGGLSMRILPYCHILDCARMINRSGYPVMFYLHPWEFDTESGKAGINLPINRKFMHYYNLESTAKKTELLLRHLQFSTVEDVLGFKVSHCQKYVVPIGNGKYYDLAYFKSLFPFLLVSIIICSVIFMAAYLIKQYAFLLIIIMSTVFYWPWGLLINKINIFFQKH